VNEASLAPFQPKGYGDVPVPDGLQDLRLRPVFYDGQPDRARYGPSGAYSDPAVSAKDDLPRDAAGRSALERKLKRIVADPLIPAIPKEDLELTLEHLEEGTERGRVVRARVEDPVSDLHHQRGRRNEAFVPHA
jgi:hypothetical protein